MKKPLSILRLLFAASLLAVCLPTRSAAAYIDDKTLADVAAAIAAKAPPSEKGRLELGAKQAASLWTKEDGTPAEFKSFCETNAVSGAALDAVFQRFETKLEYIVGFMKALHIEVARELEEDRGELLPVDKMFATYSPDSHFLDDAFKTKLAFAVLLNFPIKTLQESLAQGPGWTREQWARMRLAQAFSHRVPADVQQKVTQAYVDAEDYISGYDIYMDHVAGPDGKPLFRDGLRLISHWGLRDELKGLYADPAAGLQRQRAIQAIMERVIAQEIPKAAIGKPKGMWEPIANTLDGGKAEREPDTRYEKLLAVFRAEKLQDPYYPTMPTHFQRSFELQREMPEAQVERLLIDVLEADAGRAASALISKRLGRKLEPFDIWYSGFKPRGSISEEQLDTITKKRFSSRQAFQKAIPAILEAVGFDKDTAGFVASKIELDPARGAGHASQPEMRGQVAHLRARVGKDGMDFQGFNTAMHELGHCVEMVFSLYKIDHYLLRGVPNNAFTEGFAFVFQAKDLQVLGQAKPDPKAAALKTIDDFWSTREIAGVGLVDMRTWRWMYAHPEATPAQLRQAVIDIAKDVWDRYYGPVLGARKGDPLLAIYSHIIEYGLYLPSYPLGHIIAYQVEDYYKTHPLGKEMERMCRVGSVTPAEWMRQAIGASVSAEPLTRQAAEALKAVD